jgi:ferredoxin-NADP reductase
VVDKKQMEVLMQAYRTHLVIENPNQVTLSDLPFQPGQYVEVLLIAQDEDRTAFAKELTALLKETQALPQAQLLTEEDITSEIAAYRRGQ